MVRVKALRSTKHASLNKQQLGKASLVGVAYVESNVYVKPHLKEQKKTRKFISLNIYGATLKYFIVKKKENTNQVGLSNCVKTNKISE